MKGKKYIWGILYGFLLTGFTVYVLLDTFVITRIYLPVTPGNLYSQTEYGENSSETNTKQSDASDEFSTESGSDSAGVGENSDISDESSSENSSDSAVITENTYKDGNISVSITEQRQNDTSVYVADVRLNSAEYLKTALAKNAYGKNVTEKTSVIAENHQAILAINGDYYGSQENGYVLRNGVLYRSSAARNQEDLVIYKDGSFAFISESEVSAEEPQNDGAAQILSFGPGLIKDGAVCVSQNDEVGKAKASNPRTAVGMIDALHYVFVVSDGRTNDSEGLSLYELAEFMQSLGVRDAYNLDGGGSSTMVFCGEVINNPTTNGNSIKERSVSDIVYIGYQ